MIKKRLLALCLALVMLASVTGCGGAGDVDANADGTINTPAEPDTTTAPEIEEDEPDYTKYNAYITVYDLVYDMDSILDAYFSVVDYAPEFALVEGADYSTPSKLIPTEIVLTYPVSSALELADEEPSYPDADSALKLFADDLITLMEQFGELDAYMQYAQYEEDSYEKAAACHAKIYQASERFDQAFPLFLDAMDVLVEETSAGAIARLLEEGELIAYYSRLVINDANEIVRITWEQAANLEDGQVLDTAPLVPVYESFQTNYAALAENMGDQEQLNKISYFQEENTSAQYNISTYSSACEALQICMAELMGTDFVQQTDFLEPLERVSDATGKLIDQYNNYIAG